MENNSLRAVELEHNKIILKYIAQATDLKTYKNFLCTSQFVTFATVNFNLIDFIINTLRRNIDKIKSRSVKFSCKRINGTQGEIVCQDFVDDEILFRRGVLIGMPSTDPEIGLPKGEKEQHEFTVWCIFLDDGKLVLTLPFN